MQILINKFYNHCKGAKSLNNKLIISLTSIIFLSFLFANFQASEISLLFRTEAMQAGLQLFLAAICFAAIGKLICLSIGAYRPQQIIWLILIGQASSSLWIYLRSGLNLITDKYLDAIIPLSFFDLLPLLLVFIFKAKSLVNKTSVKSCLRISIESLPIFVACWICAQRELPRLSMLSSDPDLHVFWAAQIQRMGTIPNSLGTWGPESLNYPAGFSVLNYLWSSFSLLDLQQIISVQTLIQSLFSVLIIASACKTLLKIKNKNLSLGTTIDLFLLSIFFFLLPYGHQINFFHLEGTGRTSCLFYLAALCLCAAAVYCRPSKQQPNFIILTSLIGYLLIGINPINALYAGPCIAIMFFVAIYLVLFKHQKKLILILLLPLTLFCDPYFISPQKAANSLDINGVTLGSSLVEGLINAIHQPINAFSGAYSSYMSVDFYQPITTHKMLISLVIFYIITRPTIYKRGRVELLYLSLCSIVLTLLSLVIIPGLSPLTNQAKYRLLFPYTLHLSQQITFLLVFFLIAFIVFRIFKRLGTPWLLVASIPLLLTVREIRDYSSQLRMEPRYAVASGMGAPTANDLIVISQIEKLNTEILQRHANLTPDKMPKILIPNFLADLGWEQWLFPYGGSRILALHNVMPLAFYYSQGWKDFSYKNYKDKICNKFELQWLIDRNIRFLFLPEQRGPICIRNLERIASEQMTLFRSGNSMFIKLF